MNATKPDRLSLEDFHEKRRKIEEKAAEMQARAVAVHDQELARLLFESGWSEKEIAGNSGVEEAAAVRCLRFGRFLKCAANGHKSRRPNALNEDRFHSYWDRTDERAGEEQRFAEVVALMQENSKGKPVRPSNEIAMRIINLFANGAWHDIRDIATAAGASVDDVRLRLKNMEQRRTYGVFCESRKAGKSVKYRIVKGGGKKLDMETLQGEVSPIISRLEAEGKKNMATMSPLTVLNLSSELKKVVDKLAK